jgi:hypothetical protein
MEPISAIVGVGTIGYLINEYRKKKNFEYNNIGQIATELPNSCAENYPWNYIENFGESKKEINNQESINKESSNIVLDSPINNEYLLNANERPISDFLVNNTVPGSTRQNMVGTGVKQGNIDFSKYNVGNGRLTSHYKTLSSFTGCDENYRHKREVPNMFSPAERTDTNTIPGRRPESERPDLDRYTTSILLKPDEKPTESIRVGPGINVDPSMPTDGQGFNSGLTVRPMPNNVGEYKLTQIVGRVSGTKSQAPDLPQSIPGNAIIGEDSEGNEITYGVPSKNKNLHVTLEDRPLLHAQPGSSHIHSLQPTFVPRSALGKKNTFVQFGQSVKT